jgi:hypothetical protein
MKTPKTSIIIGIILFLVCIGALFFIYFNGRGPSIIPRHPWVGKTDLETSEDGNFTLHVSNQSFAIDPVDIKIYIDNKLAVNQEFTVETQHNWLSFKFKLEPGKHYIKAVSQTGEAVMEKEFEVKDKHWVVIDYWYYPKEQYREETKKHFSWMMQDEPIGFM